jgi:hypothetical protein
MRSQDAVRLHAIPPGSLWVSRRPSIRSHELTPRPALVAASVKAVFWSSVTRIWIWLDFKILPFVFDAFIRTECIHQR